MDIISGPRRSCFHCHKVMRAGWVPGWFDALGERLENDDIAYADFLCLSCETALWQSEGYRRVGEADYFGLHTIVWVNGAQDVVYQTLDPWRR
jgi:hypothetical protein